MITFLDDSIEMASDLIVITDTVVVD